MFPPQTLISVHEWFGTEFSTANFCRQPSWVDRLIKPDIVMGFLMLETIQHTTKLFWRLEPFFNEQEVWKRSPLTKMFLTSSLLSNKSRCFQFHSSLWLSSILKASSELSCGMSAWTEKHHGAIAVCNIKRRVSWFCADCCNKIEMELYKSKIIWPFPEEINKII